MALTRKGVTFAWTGEQQVAFDTTPGPYIVFSSGDTDASLFAVSSTSSGMIASRSLWLIPTPVLYYTTGNVGGSGHVHSLSFVFEGSEVYTVH